MVQVYFDKLRSVGHKIVHFVQADGVIAVQVRVGVQMRRQVFVFAGVGDGRCLLHAVGLLEECCVVAHVACGAFLPAVALAGGLLGGVRAVVAALVPVASLEVEWHTVLALQVECLVRIRVGAVEEVVAWFTLSAEFASVADVA